MKKLLALLLALVLLFSFSACSKKSGNSSEEEISSTASQGIQIIDDDTVARVGSMKGPTSIGLAEMMSADNSNVGKYEFTVETAADAIKSALLSDKLDIALIPANLASVLYNKTEGKIKVININTYNVLYFLSADDSIVAPTDLKGKKIYLTGKGTTPDYTLQFLLNANNISLDEVTLEYKSEATEVLAAISADSKAVALLPQPFVTVALGKNANLKIVMDMGEVIGENSEGVSSVVTGVTVVTEKFLKEHPIVVDNFLTDHRNSVEFVRLEPETYAPKLVELGIVPNANIGVNAIPKCSVACVINENMKEELSAYLGMLHKLNPQSIGGKLPGDDFYVIND